MNITADFLSKAHAIRKVVTVKKQLEQMGS